jgi:hypothetical protein
LKRARGGPALLAVVLAVSVTAISAFALTGCAWIIGVSEDVVIVTDGGPDAPGDAAPDQD